VPFSKDNLKNNDNIKTSSCFFIDSFFGRSESIKK